VSEQEHPPTKIRVSDKRVIHEEDVNAPVDESLLEPSLEQQLAEARALAEDRLDQMKRMKAEFENSKQRMIREQTDVIERASRRIVEQLLPVLDDFERALESALEHAADESIVRGVELVLGKLRDVLSAEGLERMDVHGKPFDPHEHEAVSSQPGDVSEATVLDVVRPGYKLKGKTVRPALVRVETPRHEEATED
jgi:molecular chaperone GrpE